MKRFASAWVVIAGMLTGAGMSQGAPAPTTTLIMPPAPLLPLNERLVADDASAGVPADKPELAAILKEDGLKTVETRAVKAAAGEAFTGWVRAYQFGDATGAFAAYTYFRQGGRPATGDSRNPTAMALPGGELVLLDGVSVVRTKTTEHGEGLKTLLGGIETGLPKIGGRRGLAPLLPTLMPRAGLEPASLRYALGPVGYQQAGGVLPPEMLGWDKSAEIATAKFDGKAGDGSLTLLLYPTPQIAGDRGRAIEAAVNQRIAREGAASFGTVKLRRIGPLVGMSSGGFTAEQAQALLGSLHLNQEISFDKPMPLEFHAEVRKTATLLQQIAVFTGVGILAAVVIGVFLGGARAGWRVLHGKPAYSEPEFLRIDLRGRPATLEAGDSGDRGPG